jgi:hypothetical protein
MKKIKNVIKCKDVRNLRHEDAIQPEGETVVPEIPRGGTSER